MAQSFKLFLYWNCFVIQNSIDIPSRAISFARHGRQKHQAESLALHFAARFQKPGLSPFSANNQSTQLIPVPKR
jgi:hypothetical protein